MFNCVRTHKHGTLMLLTTASNFIYILSYIYLSVNLKVLTIFLDIFGIYIHGTSLIVKY